MLAAVPQYHRKRRANRPGHANDRSGTDTNSATTKQSRLAVYCRVDNDEGILRTGMTGFGRVHSEKKFLGWFLVNKALRLMRTEFWW